MISTYHLKPNGFNTRYRQPVWNLIQLCTSTAVHTIYAFFISHLYPLDNFNWRSLASYSQRSTMWGGC